VTGYRAAVREARKTIRLDVGCGSQPRGDVNLDLFFGLSPHHRNPIHPKEIPNFVLGDAQHLPFKGGAFTAVVADNVLEHLERPYEALGEFIRVARTAYIVVPNNPVLEEHPEHLYTWTSTSLRNLLSRFYEKVEVRPRSRGRDVGRSRVFRLCRRLPVLKRPLLRFLSRAMAVELHAVCREAKS